MGGRCPNVPVPAGGRHSLDKVCLGEWGKFIAQTVPGVGGEVSSMEMDEFVWNLWKTIPEIRSPWSNFRGGSIGEWVVGLMVYLFVVSSLWQSKNLFAAKSQKFQRYSRNYFRNTPEIISEILWFENGTTLRRTVQKEEKKRLCSYINRVEETR